MNLTEKKAQFEDIISHLHAELQKLRTARANPAMVEDLQADYYGTKTPLKQLGSISVPEPRQLLISPWDKSVLAAIEKAIRDSGLGLNPANEGDKIRVTVPQLTEERRKELTKIAGKTGEETRVRLRNLREELTKEIKKEFEEKAITEDDKFRVQEELQKVMDEYNKKVKDLQDTKEKEIMTI
ncbi:MAG: Ribosome-recycling factor [Parcubacteria group bacterium GW2011_GWA2_51_12]|nr:MAG: Ribosome-recycling factor [Parcubacteria group bacterium GW2011_GWA2_51_12]